MASPEITRERLNFSMTRKVKWRYLMKKFDRFRREYIVWLDRNNSEPVGQIERHFTAPVDIPDEYMSFPEDKPWRVELDLLKYARYLKQALVEWEARVADFRGRLAKDQPDEKALQLAGPPPQDWRLIILMDRGDPWCLGLTEQRTPAVEAVIGKAPTRQQLREEARKGPANLRLDPELEALVAGTIPKRFPDEPDEQGDDDEADLREISAQSVRRVAVDEEAERRKKMNAALGFDPSAPVTGDPDQAEEEDILTGDLDLDDPLGAEDADLAARLELQDQVDPGATGGKKQDPRKNKTKPRE